MTKKEVPVIINNNAGPEIQVDQKFDGKQIEITIAKVVTQNIARGGEIDRAIKGRYGSKVQPQRR